MTLPAISRRGFLGAFGAFALAAPAIVRAASLMPVRAPKLGTVLRIRLPSDFRVLEGPILAYPQLDVKPDWLMLDEYCERILQPMVARLQQNIANSVMSAQHSSSGLHTLLVGPA